MSENKVQMEKICYNCERAVRIEGSDMCVCSKKGMVRADKSCSSFKEDLLKYEPSRPKMPSFPAPGE